MSVNPDGVLPVERRPASHTNTTSKKDIDNLLKLVFDSLQWKVDSQRKITRTASD